MRLQTAPISDKRGTWLHLLLVVGVLLYVYSPFLDHWLDKDVYFRPHTHINVTVAGVPLDSTPYEFADRDGHDDHGEHDEGAICLLNIHALMSLLLSLYIAPQSLMAAPEILAARLAPTCLGVTIVYLSSLDPPPTV